MKLATILLWAVALNAGHDWHRPPEHTPGSPVPEPSTYILIGGGLAAIAVVRKLRK